MRNRKLHESRGCEDHVRCGGQVTCQGTWLKIGDRRKDRIGENEPGVFWVTWLWDILSAKNGCHFASVSMFWKTLTHWGRVTHICVSKLTIIGSDNGLSPGRRQAIIWTNAGILLIRTLGTNFSEILGEIHSFSFSKVHLKMSSAKWRPFGLGLNELIGRSNHGSTIVPCAALNFLETS